MKKAAGAGRTTVCWDRFLEGSRALMEKGTEEGYNEKALCEEELFWRIYDVVIKPTAEDSRPFFIVDVYSDGR
jgi:hypothetical protein